MIKLMPADVFDDRGENHKGKDDEFLSFSPGITDLESM